MKRNATKALMTLCAGLSVFWVAGCSDQLPAGPVAGPDAPIVLITALEGKSFKIGNSLNLEWAIYPEVVVNGVIVEVSVDGGENWAQIQNVNGNRLETLPVGTTSMAWTIPPEIIAGPDNASFSTVSDNCLLRITEYETDNVAQTASPFRITL